MQPTASRQSPLIRTIGELAILSACIAVIYLLLAPEVKTPFHPVSIADLKGVWTSTHPTYRDRFLQFDDGTITFGWGAAGRGTYALERIASEPADRQALVRIRYKDLETTGYQFSFFYVDQSGGMIQMKGQSGVYWLRTSDQPTHDPQFR